MKKLAAVLFLSLIAYGCYSTYGEPRSFCFEVGTGGVHWCGQ